MDPRLNPKLNPAPTLVQDVNSPTSATPVHPIEGPNPPAPDKPLTNSPTRPDDRSPALPGMRASVPEQKVSSFRPTEVVDAIPVHQQAQAPVQTPAIAAPIVQMPGYNQVQAEPQDDLDKILQAVNNRVKAPSAAVKSKPKGEILSKLKSKFGKIKGADNTNTTRKPIVAMSVVVFIAVSLSTVAVMAYRQGQNSSAQAKQPGKVGTSYTAGAAIQAAGGTLVRPSDLDDYSQTLSEKLNGLNDSQDFDAASLSDGVLGL
jgi:hypothetical protein